MTLTIIMELPGATQQQYDKVMDLLQLGGKSPRGQLLHVAGPITGGWSVVDVWESQEVFDRFFQEKLSQALQEAGMPSPQLKVVPAHNIIIGVKSTS